ncbi:hypothetical protein HUW46_09289 [Amycolatopsis sp. CA-230715]|nr:hypothetical protein HUW46_09289 [Amycolatopsis sp. CA-230715]
MYRMSTAAKSRASRTTLILTAGLFIAGAGLATATETAPAAPTAPPAATNPAHRGARTATIACLVDADQNWTYDYCLNQPGPPE